MPRTPMKTSPALSIRFQDNKDHYSPGETVLGVVCRKSPIVAPQANIRVALHGREKSKLVEQHSNGSSSYRGRVNLIDEHDPDRTQHIFSGPLHIPERGEEQVWPFAITIPTHISPQAAKQLDMRQTFFPNETSRQSSTHPLPSTFTLNTLGNTEAFVEYYVVARLAISGHSGDVIEAISHINIISLDPKPPIADFGVRKTSRPISICNYQLLPGVHREDLSFKQKFKQSVNSSSVPTFHYKMEIDIPTILQIDNPTPIPFSLRAVPNWNMTSKALHGQPQKIRLTEISMSIEAVTHIKTEGTFNSHDKTKSEVVQLDLRAALTSYREPVYVPCTEEWPSINIGELLGIRLGRNGYVRNTSLDRRPQLYPGFTTYNIRLTHLLHWEFRTVVAGEYTLTRGTQPITLLEASDDKPLPEAPAETVPSIQDVGRSESWIRPPAEEEAPPSFHEVQTQDGKVGV